MSLFWWATVALILSALTVGALAWGFWTSQRVMLIGSGVGLIGSIAASYWFSSSGISVLLSDLAIVLAISLIGWFFAKMIRTLSALLVMLLTAALVDLVSFYLGPTHTFIESASNRVLHYLSFTISTPSGLLPAMGAGDLFFLFISYTVFLTTRHRHLFFYLVPSLALEAAIVVGVIVGGVPALPFLAGAVGLLNWSARRQEPVHAGEPTPGSESKRACS